MSLVGLSTIEDASAAGVSESPGGDDEKVAIHPPLPDSL